MSQPLIDALQLIREDDWDSAHQIVQDSSGVGAARIHGFLHRIEGDHANAGYWYR